MRPYLPHAFANVSHVTLRSSETTSVVYKSGCVSDSIAQHISSVLSRACAQFYRSQMALDRKSWKNQYSPSIFGSLIYATSLQRMLGGYEQAAPNIQNAYSILRNSGGGDSSISTWG